MRFRLMLPTAGVLTMLCATQVVAAPIVVACGPGQRAIVRDTFVRGETVTRVECVGVSTYRPSVYRTPSVARYRATRPHRSWGKTALIIGGGVASLYEGAHRR